MRRASPERLIKVAKATIEERDVAGDKLAGIVPMVQGHMLKRMTDEGYLHAFTVQDDETVHYVFWLNFTVDGGCYVNYVVQMLPNPVGLSVLCMCVEELAEKRGARYVRFNTQRLGLVEKAKELGYTVDSLTCHKDL